MNNKHMFVQFIHPGSEHTEDTGTRWNCGPRHYRKFLISEGSYLPALNEMPQTAEILFWGEWEPPSDVVTSFTNPLVNGPHTIFRPWYYTPVGGTNTDPFVFAGPFLYSCCQQSTEKSKSQLSFLEPGSVILFGSHKGGSFTLDTVFVVKCWVDYLPSKYVEEQRSIVPAVFTDTVLKTFLPNNAGAFRSSCASKTPCKKQEHIKNRLYFGVTYEERENFNGMFSYVPCLPYAPQSQGFARPVISPSGHLHGKITPGIRQGGKHVVIDSSTVMYSLWREVTEQVFRAGLMLGSEIKTPDLRPRPD